MIACTCSHSSGVLIASWQPSITSTGHGDNVVSVGADAPSGVSKRPDVRPYKRDSQDMADPCAAPRVIDWRQTPYWPWHGVMGIFSSISHVWKILMQPSPSRA